jgi:microcystin-dependent protein
MIMKPRKLLLGALGLTSASFAATPAMAQDQFLGQIMETPYNFCPRGWLATNGQILAISSNTALFSLLGTTYGGNGQTTFALPDLRGRESVQVGQGPGLSSYSLGEVAGTETVTLTVNQLPIHNHVGNFFGSTLAPDSEKAKKGTPATFQPGDKNYQRTTPPDQIMAAGAITTDPAGGSQPFSIRDPYLVMQFCISTVGIFPARN